MEKCSYKIQKHCGLQCKMLVIHVTASASLDLEKLGQIKALDDVTKIPQYSVRGKSPEFFVYPNFHVKSIFF